MVCPACTAENSDGAKFCNECGQPLALRCPGCGTPHGPGQKFCEECGTPLAASATAPSGPGAAVAAASHASDAELRFVSVLFVDLVGFTALSEGREAEDVRELLGHYFELAKTVVGRYGGAIEKFIGDAVMAVWGVPVAREDDAERSVRAALELVDAVTAFGEEAGVPGLRARAGVVSGQAAALERSDEGIVVGDRVNTASRVQAAAAPGTVLVDDVTRQVTSSVVAYEDAGEHTAKGISEPLHLWRATRVVAGYGGRDAEQLLEAPFVGRDPELRLLKELFHATTVLGSARLVGVNGEAGMGKSRLRREFSNYVDGLADRFLWHQGRCLSYGDGIAYWALSEIVRQRLGLPEDVATDEAAQRLADGLQEWIADPAERAYVAPRLGTLLGIAQPNLDRPELFAGWRLFFERLAAVDPVVLVFEDMQWADAGLLAFIEQLIELSAGAPIFVLTLARPQLAAASESGWPTGRPGATVIELGPLDDASMQALLKNVVDGLPAAAQARIVAQAQGVPLYAIETVRALVDRGALELSDGRLVAVGELGELEVPASLNALLASRLDALAPEERELVRALSVFGGAFPRASAFALSELGEPVVERALDGLLRKQVLAIRADPLSPERGQYAFAQGMLRTVAYEMLSRRERKQRHLAAADHLTHVFPKQGEEVAEAIAGHLMDALRAVREDDPDREELRARAVRALRRSGERAATVGAPEVARRTYEQAAAIAEEPDQPELLRAAGEMAVQAGASVDAIELLDRAAELYGRAGRWREQALCAGTTAGALRNLGRLRQAIERVGRALETLPSEGSHDPDRARLQAALGRVLVFAGELEQAAPVLDEALAAAQALELPDVLAEALINKAILYEYRNRAEEAEALYSAAIRRAEQFDLGEALARASGNLANLSMMWDRPEASEHVETTISANRRRGDRYRESLGAGNLMNVRLLTGRWGDVVQLADGLLTADPDRPGTEYLRHRLVQLLALRGDLAAAAAALGLMSAWADSDDVEVRGLYDVALLALRAAERQGEDALTDFIERLPSVVDMVSLASDVPRDGWPYAFAIALGAGRIGDARTLLDLIADRPRGLVPPYLRAHLARGRALLAAVEDRHETVEADLMVAIDAFAALAYPYWRAVTQTDLAEWLIEQGRDEEAEPLLAEAIDVFEPLGAAPALERARSLSAARILEGTA
jgi:class 3 adenylate cyclase/predicted ATPase